MSRIPTVMRVFGWGAFFLVFFLAFAPPAKNYLNAHVGETLAFIIPFCFTPFIVAGVLGADLVSARLKNIAATRGHEVVAQVVGTAYMGSEGSKRHSHPIIRFDLEVEEGGRIRRASTEVKDLGQSSYRNYPPGTKLLAKFDPQTGSIVLLDSHRNIIESI